VECCFFLKKVFFLPKEIFTRFFATAPLNDMEIPKILIHLNLGDGRANAGLNKEHDLVV